MKKYRVHIYAVVRIPVDVEAESQIKAIKKAEANTHLHTKLTNDEVKYAEEISGFLVDEIGDEEHINSRHYDANMNPLWRRNNEL